MSAGPVCVRCANEAANPFAHHDGSRWTCTVAASPEADEIEAVLAEHAPHLLGSWRATLRLYRLPDYLRARADEIERSAVPAACCTPYCDKACSPTCAERNGDASLPTFVNGEVAS